MNLSGGPSLQAGFIPLRGGARQQPLFVIQDRHSIDEVFGLVAERGNAGFPVYGLLCRGSGEHVPRTVEGLAVRLLETIQAIQPQGPYRLAAWPDCALVAYEIGIQLVGQDQRVEFIGLVGDMVCCDPRDYVPQPCASLPLHLFVGPGAAAREPGTVSWRELLPAAQVHTVTLARSAPGSMPAPGQARTLTEAVRAATGRAAPRPEAAYRPLLTIQSGMRGVTPLFCIPGAGDSVTGFAALATELGLQRPVHGLQPRGVDGLLTPHSTVRAAAECYLRAIVEQQPAGPVHLMGHSFGGWVALEIANLLLAVNRQVASLTLIDSEAPGQGNVLGKEHTACAVAEQFSESLALLAQGRLALDRGALAAADEPGRLQLLHGAAVRAGLLPARSQPAILKGCLRTFGSALRTAYRPAAYPGPVRLVLLPDTRLDGPGNERQYRRMEEGWRKVAPRLSCWHGPGNHMTILKAPHAASLARWWGGAREEDGASVPVAEPRDALLYEPSP